MDNNADSVSAGSVSFAKTTITREEITMDINTAITLNNHVRIPQFGLGVFKSAAGEETYNAVRWALEAGYRHIDTAKIYANEGDVGRAVRDSQIPRDKIFITTKLWNQDMREDRQEQAFHESLKLLCLDYVDLYLIHWPVAGKYVESWVKMEEIYQAGLIRAIGISNFNPHHIDTLLEKAVITPALNQIELHPLLIQADVTNYCLEKGIAVSAWSPLGRGRLLDHPVLTGIAARYQRTAAQVILRWHLQHGRIVIPKSVHKDRIISNTDLYTFELAAKDVAAIDALNRSQRFGSDPETFTY